MTAQRDIHEYLERADVLFDLRRYDAALDLARDILTADPDEPLAHTVVCRALLGLGRIEEAVAAAREAVRLDPTSPYSLRLLAYALVKEAGPRKGRLPDEAIEAALAAVRLAPDDVHCYTTLAEVYAKAGRVKDADAAVRHALALDPLSSDVWGTASVVGLTARNWYAAERAARRALALEPGNSVAVNNLGVALDRQGYWPLAAVAYLDAARSDPQNATARANVEAVGFRQLEVFAVIPLLPLLIVAPVFLAARLAVGASLGRRPKRLRPLALRLGLRVAGSRRRQRRFAKHTEKVERAVSDPSRIQGWSAVSGRRLVSNGFLGLLGGGLVLFGLVLASAAVTGRDRHALVPWLVIACVFVVVGTVMLWRMRVRRWSL